MAYNSTFRYIDDVVSIYNDNFHSYVDTIYPGELEIKDTTESDTSASYLDILLEKDTNGNLTTKLYDKRDDFTFSIVNLLTSNLMKQEYQQSRLKSSFRKFYGRYNDLVSKYNLSLSQMLIDVFHTNC